MGGKKKDAKKKGGDDDAGDDEGAIHAMLSAEVDSLKTRLVLEQERKDKAFTVIKQVQDNY